MSVQRLVFIDAWFDITRNWKQYKCPSIGKWKNKLWYIYIYIYNGIVLSRRKPQNVDPPTTAWINLKTCMQKKSDTTEYQFSRSVMSYSLWPHGLQHASLPWASPTPGACAGSIKSVMPCNHLILCHPLLFLPSIFPSIRVFSNESVLRIRWPQFWSFSFSISPSSEYSGLGRVISWHWLSWRMERGRAFMTGQMIGGRMLITLAEIQ